jgi:hypothetical protein
MPEIPTNSSALLSLNEEDRFKLLQVVHTALTGRSAKKTRAFEANFKVGPENLEQLHVKLAQTRTQWKPQLVLSNENVTFFYVGGHKDEFPSYELSKLYDRTRAEPIEYINYQSNFIISRPDEPAESYTVDVRIVSTAALSEGVSRIMGTPSLLRFLVMGAITVEVKYVQLPIALGIEACIESWVKEIELGKAAFITRYGPKYSHWIPRLFAGAISVMAVTAASRIAVSLPANATTRDCTLLIIIALPFVALLAKASLYLGHFVEAEVDKMQIQTFLKFNIGDEKLLKRSEGRFRALVLKSIFAAVGIVAQFLYVSPFLDWLFAALKSVGLKN